MPQIPYLIGFANFPIEEGWLHSIPGKVRLPALEVLKTFQIELGGQQ